MWNVSTHSVKFYPKQLFTHIEFCKFAWDIDIKVPVNIIELKINQNVKNFNRCHLALHAKCCEMLKVSCAFHLAIIARCLYFSLFVCFFYYDLRQSLLPITDEAQNKDPTFNFFSTNEWRNKKNSSISFD